MIVEDLSARISDIPRFSHQYSWETVLIGGTEDNTVTGTCAVTEEVGLRSSNGKLKVTVSP